MARAAYSTDLTDAQWALIEPFCCPAFKMPMKAALRMPTW
jgi:hypothetical protein